MPTEPDRAAPPVPADPAAPTAPADAVPSRTGQLFESAHRSSASFELAFAPVLLALIGLWLDRTLGTTPFLVVAGAVLGVLGAGVKIYYQYRHQMSAHAAAGPWSARSTDRERVA